MSDRVIGKTLGDFRIEELIGRGSVGKVYRATQLSLNRPVAVKVLEEGLFTLGELKQRFLREASYLARLEHPNIVPIYATGQEENLYYYAMRLVRGKSLADCLATGLAIPDGVRICADVCGALQYAHARGIIHRDVKPANIMIADGVTLLANFGLARLMESTSITPTGALLGTPMYFSPEQAGGERATPQSDLYSVGIILYQIATGGHPFAPLEAKSRPTKEVITRVLRGVFASPRSLRPEIPERLEQIIVRALRREPTDRYGSARELQADLRALLAQRTTGALDRLGITVVPGGRSGVPTPTSQGDTGPASPQPPAPPPPPSPPAPPPTPPPGA